MGTKLKDKASVEAIIREMSVREKAACITGGTSFYSRAMEKYGIPELLLLDGGTGFNTNQYFLDVLYRKYEEKMRRKGTPVDLEACTARMGGLEIVLNDEELWASRTQGAKDRAADLHYGCYPPGMFFGATWNPEVIEECGKQLGEECNVRGVDVLLGTPNINIHRDPLNGRLFEGYSEDPCLVAKLAPSFVKGVQSTGLLADVKHFAANNQETDRMGVNEMIPERALREIYFPGFKACVEAGVKSVMSAYNKINGTACAHNRWLLKDVLRGEWGFDGFVVSDWSAAYDQVKACEAGNDLVMPGPRQLNPIVNAVHNGTLSEADLDECVRHFLYGVLDTPAMKGRLTSYDIKAGEAAAYRAACEGITLLKNKNDLLPLSKSGASADLAVFGKYSKKLITSGAGSAKVNTDLDTNIYDELVNALGQDHVSFEELRPSTTAVIVTVGSNGQEGSDRVSMTMDPDDREALDRAIAQAKKAGLPVIVLMNIAGPIEMTGWEPDTDAILCLYLPGMQGGKAAVDILLGKVNPSGKLPLTLPKYYSDCPSYGNFPGYNDEVWYGEGIYVGYRWYEKRQIQPMYPFGFGLSYTTFEIEPVSAPASVNVDEEDVKVMVRVKNTGRTAGSEVVQLYVQDPVSTLDKPVKELKAFRKVFLKAGEEKNVELVLKKEDFASYDVRLGHWAAEPGEFKLLIGNASDHITITRSVNIACRNPYGISAKTTIVKLLANEKATAICEQITGVKLKEVAGSYIVFQPNTVFTDIWKDCVRPAIDADDETCEAMLQQICSEWMKL